MDLFESIRNKLAACPAHRVEPGNRAHASVAMILRRGADGMEILLMERAININDLWSGHVGFPGGKVEPTDKSPQRTAERETLEELGIDLRCGKFLGRLSDVLPGGLPIVISCFVYAVAHPPVLVPDANEVAKAFWFPLNESKNPNRRADVKYEIRNQTKTFPALSIIEWTQQPLWGVSFRLLRNLHNILD